MQTTNDDDAIEAAIWAVAERRASAADLELLDGESRRAARIVGALLGDTQARLESVQGLTGPERDQVVADFAEELGGLRLAYEQVYGHPEPSADAVDDASEEQGVRLQASWSDGEVVVWAAGPGEDPAENDELADRLEALGGPAVGWRLHPPIPLPNGTRAEAVSIPIADALGWLAAVGGALGVEPDSDGEERDDEDEEGVGASVRWLGRMALVGVEQVTRGAIVPTLRTERRGDRTVELAVRWQPALLGSAVLDRHAAAMPGPVRATAPPSVSPRALLSDFLGAVVHAIVSQAARMVELPAPPPVVRTGADVAEATMLRPDGSAFTAPAGVGFDVAEQLHRWSRPVTNPARPRLVVQLDQPDRDGAWLLTVLAPGPNRSLVEVDAALAAKQSTRAISDELARLERMFAPLGRLPAGRRGKVYLSGDEAWRLMTSTGEQLDAAGFEVRVPAMSRQRPKPGLRMFVETVGETVVGARQLSNVHWTAVFDDVELTAADVARLAAEARPLVRSRGRWVELDRVDLKEAAAALAERATTTQLTGAEILRHAVGLEGAALGERVLVQGTGWAADLLDKAASATMETGQPAGFEGTLRTYQAEALAWLGFLDAVDLGGCLALDMGLGKTPTVLAHLARNAGDGPALVVAPPAVVGNWEAEAHRFTPDLRVVIHHGPNRATIDELADEVAGADVVITTYGTAVRDVDALAATSWRRVILDEAQAIKNPASESSQVLRRIPGTSRLALTGTPIENGLGDLWSILDFCNPGLVGDRPSFVAQLAGEGEAALRALNGILVFRRTKSEPDVAAELPDRIDELDHCTMTPEQIGLYQAVLDSLVATTSAADQEPKPGAVLAAITALKQICNHPAAYEADDRPLSGRSGKLTRLEELVEAVFAAGERMLIFTHFAEWGKRLADHLTTLTGLPIACYHGGLARGARDRLVRDFQGGEGPGALVLSLTAGGTGLNLTAANHVVLYDRWWNPAKEDQARDRAWRIGQTRTVVSHRLVCPGTIDERVEDVVAGKRRIADLVLPKSSSLDDLGPDQLRVALGLDSGKLLVEDA